MGLLLFDVWSLPYCFPCSVILNRDGGRCIERSWHAEICGSGDTEATLSTACSNTYGTLFWHVCGQTRAETRLQKRELLSELCWEIYWYYKFRCQQTRDHSNKRSWRVKTYWVDDDDQMMKSCWQLRVGLGELLIIICLYEVYRSANVTTVLNIDYEVELQVLPKLSWELHWWQKNEHGLN